MSFSLLILLNLLANPFELTSQAYQLSRDFCYFRITKPKWTSFASTISMAIADMVNFVISTMKIKYVTRLVGCQELQATPSKEV